MIKEVKNIIFLTVILLMSGSLFAQKVTRIKGHVHDAQTGEPLPFVDISLKGTSIGVSTDLNGFYKIETRFPSDTVVASFLGYKSQEFPIHRNKLNKIDFRLESETLKLETVEIREKKGKYSKKNNPAIDLAQKVLSNKYVNSLKGKDYYSYDRQEKIRLDLNNITKGFKETPFIRNLDYMWKYIDTSDVNGRTFLPVFIRESLSTIYYRKDGNDLKEKRKAARYSVIEETLDPKTVNDAMDVLYQNIDVYEEKIALLDQRFVGPFAKKGKDFYRYYILDTTVINGKSAINLAFIPAVKGNFGFTGNIYVSNDGKYTVLKVDMGIIQGINLNFVRDLRIVQEFEPYGDAYIKTKDELLVDYSLTENGLGLYGSRVLYFDNYNFEKPDDESIFDHLSKIIEEEGSNERDEAYWNKNRLRPLSKNDIGVYSLVEEMKNDKYYQRYSYFGNVVATGYAKAGPLSFGPVLTFVNFNKVEGLNLRLGAKTNPDFSDKFQFRGYLARAFKSKIWKYHLSGRYSFKKNYYDNPLHFIRLTAERESSFPGQELAFFDPANFFLSFQRGEATKMLLTTKYELNYIKENKGFSYHLDLRKSIRRPYGSLLFDIIDNDGRPSKLDDVNTSEITLGFRFAPNETYIQRGSKRRQIFNKYPIITVNYTHGFKDILGGDYNFDKLRINFLKQFEWLTIGKTKLILDLRKTWGTVPFVLLDIPRANQTYTFQTYSYNLMNFLEFVTDRMASIEFEHSFYGYILNRIPLIKRLKLREVVSFKAVYGDLSEKNLPQNHSGLILFPVDSSGNPTTFTFGKDPYMEASIGFTNILKILKIDLVKRINYLDLPNIPSLWGVKGLGLRISTRIEF